MLIIDAISATNVKIQKSCNSLSQVVHVDKLKVCRGEIPKSWLSVEMDNNTATASEDEPEDGENQDDGVVDDQPNELDYALVVDELAGSSSCQSDDEIADGNGDNDGRQPEQLVENTAGDQAVVEAEVTSSRPTRQRQPPAYLREYVRTIHASKSLTPLEIGCVGRFDTRAGQF